MPADPNLTILRESITIDAPIARCFALSTRIELVEQTLGMRPIDGVTSGHITAGSEVVWSGLKFGLPTRHHTLITEFNPPHPVDGTFEASFQDTQLRGRFAFFQHDHYFHQTNSTSATELHDEIRFRLSFGQLGRLVARTVVAPHALKLACRRFALLKRLAESPGAWKPYVSA
jgi:ligand-binding SRPBCC domain-containing protein